jgi:hypothetical protein
VTMIQARFVVEKEQTSPAGANTWHSPSRIRCEAVTIAATVQDLYQWHEEAKAAGLHDLAARIAGALKDGEHVEKIERVPAAAVAHASGSEAGQKMMGRLLAGVCEHLAKRLPTAIPVDEL